MGNTLHGGRLTSHEEIVEDPFLIIIFTVSIPIQINNDPKNKTAISFLH